MLQKKREEEEGCGHSWLSRGLPVTLIMIASRLGAKSAHPRSSKALAGGEEAVWGAAPKGREAKYTVQGKGWKGE